MWRVFCRHLAKVAMTEGDVTTGTWIQFVELAPKPKTKVWAVTTKPSIEGEHDPSVLGVIKFHGAWRQYAFFPDGDTLYEPKCMSEIADFIKARASEQRGVTTGSAEADVDVERVVRLFADAMRKKLTSPKNLGKGGWTQMSPYDIIASIYREWAELEPKLVSAKNMPDRARFAAVLGEMVDMANFAAFLNDPESEAYICG